MSTNIGIPTKALNKLRLSAAGNMPDHDTDCGDLPADVLAAISKQGRAMLSQLGPLEYPSQFAAEMQSLANYLWSAVMAKDTQRAREVLLTMGSLGIHAGVVLAPSGPAPHPAGHEFDVLDVDRADALPAPLEALRARHAEIAAEREASISPELKAKWDAVLNLSDPSLEGGEWEEGCLCFADQDGNDAGSVFAADDDLTTWAAQLPDGTHRGGFPSVIEAARWLNSEGWGAAKAWIESDEPSIDLPSVTHNGPEVTG